MAKRKGSKKSRQKRRKQEVIRAQNKVARKSTQKREAKKDNPLAKKKRTVEKYALPAEVIKKDLVKIVLFAALSIAFLLLLKFYGIEYTSLF